MSTAPFSIFLVRPGRPHARLAAFVALSIVVHLLTGYGGGRFGFGTARFDSPPRGSELRATLAPAPESVATTSAATATPPESGSPGPGDDGRAGEAMPERGATLPPPDKWHRASEVDVRAEPLSDVALRYPENIQGNPVAGMVRLRLFIDEGGVVRKIQVAASEPQGVFDDAARKAWQEVRFSPALLGGRAVKSQKLIEVTYQPGIP